MKERQSEAKHIFTGRSGETYAVNFLTEKGHEIIAQNYRYRRAEIDIIARKGDTILFIEVKTRSSHDHGFAESAINERKVEMVMAAAEDYMLKNDWHGQIRFDVIAIDKVPSGWKITHFEDAMH